MNAADKELAEELRGLAEDANRLAHDLERIDTPAWPGHVLDRLCALSALAARLYRTRRWEPGR